MHSLLQQIEHKANEIVLPTVHSHFSIEFIHFVSKISSIHFTNAVQNNEN